MVKWAENSLISSKMDGKIKDYLQDKSQNKLY